MAFKFEYRFYKKYIINDKAGFLLDIDSEYNSIEYCKLNSLNKIMSNEYFKIQDETKEKIKKVILDNKSVFNINSHLYQKNDNSFDEYEFYFELDNVNRKIEGSNLLSKLDNLDVILLFKVFDEISMILKEENIELKYDSLKKVS